MSIELKGRFCTIAEIFSAIDARSGRVLKISLLNASVESSRVKIEALKVELASKHAELSKLEDAMAKLQDVGMPAADVLLKIDKCKGVIKVLDRGIVKQSNVLSADEALLGNELAGCSDAKFISWYFEKFCASKKILIYDTMGDLLCDVVPVSFKGDECFVNTVNVLGRTLEIENRFSKVCPSEFSQFREILPELDKEQLHLEQLHGRQLHNKQLCNFNFQANLSVTEIGIAYISDTDVLLIFSRDFAWRELRERCCFRSQMEEKRLAAFDGLATDVKAKEVKAHGYNHGGNPVIDVEFIFSRSLVIRCGVISDAISDYVLNLDVLGGATSFSGSVNQYLDSITRSNELFKPCFAADESNVIHARIEAQWNSLVGGAWSKSHLGPLAKLKYLIEGGERPRFFNLEYEGLYGFVLRTRDHTWLRGEISIGHFVKQPDAPDIVNAYDGTQAWVHRNSSIMRVQESKN